MNRRPRHPKKELEAVLHDMESRGWDVEKGKKYYEARCTCGEHQRWVHLTPSDPNYERNLRKWLERLPCWGKDPK